MYLHQVGEVKMFENWTFIVLLLVAILEAGNAYRDERIRFNLKPPETIEKTVVTGCERKQVQLSSAHPRVALASHPGSGNTWLRHLIQETTGIASGSRFTDIELKRGGFRMGEGIHDGRVIVIKTHNSSKEERKQYEKAVLIIRHPAEALLSIFNYALTGKHTGYPKRKIFNSTKWSRHKLSDVSVWRDFNRDWLLHYQGPLHIILYDNIKRNTISELTSLMNFLEADVTSADIACAAMNSEGLHHRTKPEWMKLGRLYSKSDQFLFEMYVDDIRSILKDRWNVQWTYKDVYNE